jgi:hypothetical protein
MKTFQEWINELQNCHDCKNDPWLFLTAEKIPCCNKHWIKLADTDINWSDNTDV